MQPTSFQAQQFRRFFLRVPIGYAGFAVVLLLTLPFQWVSHPLFAVSAALSVASAGLAVMIGRLPALPATMPPDEAQQAGLQAFRSATVRRFAVVGAAAVFSLAVAFVARSSVPYLISAAVAAALIYLLVIPTPRRIRAAEQQLDSAGASSRLGETFGV
jgi:hypothetical protein